MLISISPQELHFLIFPGCACVNDDIRAHFIRRSNGNARAYATPVAHDFGQRIKAHLPASKFFVQTIQEEGLIYDVIWDKDEWEHSAERKGFIGGRFLSNDIEHLYTKAKAYRIEHIVAELGKLEHFASRKQEARKLAESITSKDDEHYRGAAKTIGETFIALGIKVTLYFSLEELVKELDHRNIIQNHEQKRADIKEDGEIEGRFLSNLQTQRTTNSQTENNARTSNEETPNSGNLRG